MGAGRVRGRVKPFAQRLAASADRAGSWLCVGLDPDPGSYPAGLGEEHTAEFLAGVLEATHEVACCYKANAAFFEALGTLGHEALVDTIAAVPPDTPIILDGKRNDIGSTARKYAQAAFDELGVDAVTVTPYLGRDTVEPFAAYEEKGVFLVCRTSNASAPDFQDLATDAAGTPLWQAVATRAMRDWQPEFGNLGLVAGATYPTELSQMRALCGAGVPLLIPGVGAQGGDASESILHGADASGRFALVNVGRSILTAKGEDWQTQIRAAAEAFAAALQPVRRTR